MLNIILMLNIIMAIILLYEFNYISKKTLELEISVTEEEGL